MNLRIINIMLLSIAAVFSNETLSFTDDELVSVRVCGDALQGNNPCDWAKKVKTTVSYLGEDEGLKLSVIDFVTTWFKEREWTLLRHADIKVADKSGWFYFAQPEGKTINIDVLVYDLDENAKCLTLSVVTSTSERYQIFSYSCPRLNRVKTKQCSIEKIKEGLGLLLNGSFKNQ